MLMRNPEDRVQSACECEMAKGEALVERTPREMLLGQIVLLLLFVIAIILRSMI